MFETCNGFEHLCFKVKVNIKLNKKMLDRNDVPVKHF